MTLHFSIDYRTAWGQNVEVELCFLSDEGRSHFQRIALETTDGLTWKGLCMLRAYTRQLRYTYLVTAGPAVLRREWDVVPRVFPAEDARTYFFADHWRDVPESSHCYTDAYMAATGHAKQQQTAVALFPRSVLFRVQAPQLEPDDRLCIVGDQPTLGNWEPRRALPMIPSAHNEWLISVSADGLRLPVQYKYVVQKADGTNFVWEEGENRQTPSLLLDKGHVVAMTDGELRLPIPHWKVAGLVVPLFSLRTEGSQGVGDFGDLKAATDWVSQAGMHAIQLLPIYDTTQGRTAQDSYPYNAISVHALHPIYADLRQLPLADAAAMAEFEARWQQLNQLPAVDYVEVIRLKEDYLHRLYEEQRRSVCQKAEYRAFVNENLEWLHPYSVFCHLRDTYGTPCFGQWPKLSAYNRSQVAGYQERHAGQVGYYTFVQYILHQQLSDAADYARSRNVFLKGDLPIGISPCSVEAWQEPHLFHMDSAAGAPPDDFSRVGQNWGFPTYDWDRMAQDGYLWWRQRLGGMSRYFSAYRIDHILGFFRIWQIPQHSVTALLGQFSPAMPLTVGEIESYGLRFQAELFTEPYIADTVLEELFEPAAAAWVRTNCLQAVPGGRYRLTETYGTQQRIRQAFDGKTDAESLAIRDGLYTLASNVLFVPDAKQPDCYHPRIGVVGESVWKSLLKHEQEAFARLYEDFYFYRHNDFWGEQAMQKLPALVGASDMLVCGEDLGMVPACVGPVMQQLGILSLEIQAMPKTFGEPFAQLHRNPYHSVATIFTHDMPTLRLWWQEDSARTQLYYNTVLQHDGPAPASLPGWLCQEVVAHHLNCPSMLCLISLQNWLSIDDALRSPDIEEERINVPANPKHYWRYRMHLPISQLQASDALNEAIRTLITRAGRA